MAIQFKLSPGRKISETEVATTFSVSRTPVREALNRLVKEGFLVVDDGSRRFTVRRLDPKECFDLYELRLSLEATSVRLAVERASDEDLASLLEMANRFNLEPENCTTQRIVELDEIFHERIALLSGNLQLLESIRLINARIRFVRLVDLEQRPRSRSLGDHVVVAQALQSRDTQAAINALEEHISRKMPDIVEVVRRCIAKIFVDEFDRSTESPVNRAC